MNNHVSNNIPHVDLAAALDPASLAIWLDYQYASHLARNNELMAAHGRFLEATEAGITTDEVVGRASDFAKQLKAEVVSTDATRTTIKAPVLYAQRLIDGEAKKLTDRLNGASTTVQTRITAYLRIKEAEARKVAEAEAARLATEAEARIAEAQESNTPEAIDAAVEVMTQADAATAKAEAPGLELTRTRSQMGSLTGLKDNWVYAVADLSKVPAHLLSINDAAVKLAIKQGARDVPGLRIYNDAKAYVR